MLPPLALASWWMLATWPPSLPRPLSSLPSPTFKPKLLLIPPPCHSHAHYAVHGSTPPSPTSVLLSDPTTTPGPRPWSPVFFARFVGFICLNKWATMLLYHRTGLRGGKGGPLQSWRLNRALLQASPQSLLSSNTYCVLSCGQCDQRTVVFLKKEEICIVMPFPLVPAPSISRSCTS